MNIFEVVAGKAGLAGVRWALLADPPREVLRRELTSLLPPGSVVERFEITRAKFKPGRYLMAYYDVCILQPGGDSMIRPIEVVWRPEGDDEPCGVPDEVLAMQEEAQRRGLSAPFRGLMAAVPAWGMRLQIAPLDIHFPQLVRLYDPTYVPEMLAASSAQRTVVRYNIASVRYRPGQRHVLRYLHSNGGGAVFAKVYNSDKGARAFKVAGSVAGWLELYGDGMRCARPLAYLHDDMVVLYPGISGTPLSQLLQQPAQETAQCLRRAGECLLTLHRMPAVQMELKQHSFEREIRSIASASEHIHALLPQVAATIARILDRGQELHERLPQEPAAFVYGDYKADHLWMTPEGLTLIDCDTCYLFDPALDLGKFLADLRWWYDGYANNGVEHAQEQFMAGYGPLISPDRLARARLYEALVLVKTTVRRVPLFESNWAPRTLRLISCADALLNSLAARAL